MPPMSLVYGLKYLLFCYIFGELRWTNSMDFSCLKPAMFVFVVEFGLNK